MNGNNKTARQQQGFTIMQMLITLVIIAVVSTFGVLGIRTARAEFRLENSARLFASYVEKARVDSIRRHAAPGDESSVETFGAGTSVYAVTMDYGSGAVETRTFQLDSGVTFLTAAQKVSFDWRGRITVPCDTKACVFQIKSDYLNDPVPVDVSGSGDITVGAQRFPDELIPEITISQVTGDVEVDPAPTPAVEESPSPETSPDATPTPTPTPTPSNGNGSGGSGGGSGSDGGGGGSGNGNGSPTPTPAPTPIASPDPDGTPMPQCVSSISPSTLSLSQSDTSRQTGSATFTMSNATGVRIISASQVGNGNSFVIGLSLVRIDGNGSSVISVTSKQGAGNRGVFIIEVSADPACGSAQQLTVSVSN